MKTLIALALMLLLFGCASNPGAPQAPANQTQQTANQSAPAQAQNVSDVAVLETSMGTIVIQLYPGKAPATVANFERYVKEGKYDGTIFHRVIKGFMIQGGGFDQAGDQLGTYPPITLEAGNGLNNTAGMVAMARTSDPNSATDQFFIDTADNPDLDQSPGNPGYAVFGQVVSGMDVVYNIENVPTGDHGSYQDWPTTPVVITKAYMQG